MRTRTGILPVFFEDGFGFERYADWLLDVPMYFVAREGRLIDVAGESFRDFMAGTVPALSGIDRHRGRFRQPFHHRVHRSAPETLLWKCAAPMPAAPP